MSFLLYLLFTLFILVCILLILMVLIQKGRGGGLASAFGGGGGNTAFGSKTGDVLTWATSVLFGVFLLLGVALNLTANAYNARVTGTNTNTALPGPGGPIAPAQGGDTSLPQPVPADPILPSPGPSSPQRGAVPPTGAPAPVPTPTPAAPAAPAAPAPSPTTPTPSK